MILVGVTLHDDGPDLPAMDVELGMRSGAQTLEYTGVATVARRAETGAVLGLNNGSRGEEEGEGGGDGTEHGLGWAKGRGGGAVWSRKRGRGGMRRRGSVKECGFGRGEGACRRRTLERKVLSRGGRWEEIQSGMEVDVGMGKSGGKRRGKRKRGERKARTDSAWSSSRSPPSRKRGARES